MTTSVNQSARSMSWSLCHLLPKLVLFPELRAHGFLLSFPLLVRQEVCSCGGILAQLFQPQLFPLLVIALLCCVLACLPVLDDIRQDLGLVLEPAPLIRISGAICCNCLASGSSPNILSLSASPCSTPLCSLRPHLLASLYYTGRGLVGNL